MEEYLKVDAMEVEIGYALIPLVDVSQGNDLLDRISMIRRHVAAEMGFLVPPISTLAPLLTASSTHFSTRFASLSVIIGPISVVSNN